MNSSIERLKQNSYPGRGIIIGLSPDEKRWYQIYWIMGRSEQSRNRFFYKEGDNVYTQVFDETKVVDPLLLIYPAVKVVGDKHIVSNGSQTNTIENFFKSGKTFFEAMFSEKYEPDAPHFTPRISGVINLEKISFVLSIIKKQDNESCLREFFCYEKPSGGIGRCIHTYNSNENPLPSFEGEPYIVPLFNDSEETINFYWNILDRENRISILLKEIEIETKKVDIKIINKNG